MPQSLHSSLVPDHCASKEGGLYEAIERMTEEMPFTRFKNDGVFIIGSKLAVTLVYGNLTRHFTEPTF